MMSGLIPAHTRGVHELVRGEADLDAFLLAGHGGVKLCRPSEAFTQEDGEAVVAISGRRIAGGAS